MYSKQLFIYLLDSTFSFRMPKIEQRTIRIPSEFLQGCPYLSQLFSQRYERALGV